MSIAAPWHATVAKARGFDYVYDSLRVGSAWERRWPGNWVRFDLINEQWNNADLIWWFDADVVIANPNIDMSWPLRVPESVGTDWLGNAGVFWIKTNSEGRALLDSILCMSESEREAVDALRSPQLPPTRAKAGQDVMFYSRPAELGIQAHRFGSEWNHWAHRKPLKGRPETLVSPAKIEAYHGMADACKRLRMRYVVERASRGLPEHTKVALIQHGIGPQEALIKLAQPWHQSIADKQGWQYITDTVSDSTASEQRPAAWARFGLIAEYWCSADIIWWLDADALIVDKNIDLTWPSSVPELFGMDKTGNCGVLWIKTVPEAYPMIFELASMSAEERTIRMSAAMRARPDVRAHRPTQATGPLDMIVSEQPAKHLVPTYYFGGEWNFWRRAAALTEANGVCAPVKIRAWHGEQNMQRWRKMQAVVDELTWGAPA